MFLKVCCITVMNAQRREAINRMLLGYISDINISKINV